MEKIDRELLIKEISSRLPYGIKVQVLGWDEEKGEIEVPLKVYSINTDGYLSFEYNYYSVGTVYIEDCRLYLRPMSSMTEEEKVEYYNTMDKETQRNYPNSCDFSESVYYLNTIKTFDWLNTHRFDYRGLISKGLAIEVTEKNNPYKNNYYE